MAFESNILYVVNGLFSLLLLVFYFHLHYHYYMFLYNYFFLVCSQLKCNNRQTSNINVTLVGNNDVDHSDVVGAPPVGAAPTTSSFTWFQWIGQRQLQDGTRNIYVLGFGVTYIRCLIVLIINIADGWCLLVPCRRTHCVILIHKYVLIMGCNRMWLFHSGQLTHMCH